MQPTSAMATRIAISAPAAAVRASSIDAHGQRTAGLLSNDPSGQTGQKDAAVLYNQRRADPPETAVTARLQAADAMRRAQQAHIDAQQEEVKRRHQQTGSMGPSVSLIVTIHWS